MLPMHSIEIGCQLVSNLPLIFNNLNIYDHVLCYKVKLLISKSELCVKWILIVSGYHPELGFSYVLAKYYTTKRPI